MKSLLIALIFISGQAFAGATFLSSFNSSSKIISFNELLKTISFHAKKTEPVALSVGESHLHSDTALKINEMIILEYFKSSNSKIVTCLETLSHFNESSIGKYVFAQSKKTKIFKGNSPARTDFANCFEGKNKNYFTYSGFFHQYPFARPFPKEFPKTPVIDREDNNILSQMKKADTLFVTQIELEFLEFSATKSLIINLQETGDIEQFKKDGKEVLTAVESLFNAMEQVLEGPSVYSSKSAVVLSQENFTTNLNGFNNYFVLTNLDYRTFQESLGLLKFLVSLENKDLKSFADKLSQSRLFMTTLFQTPNEKGELPSSSYGRPDYTFKGNTYILHIRRSESESILFTFSQGDHSPYCLDYDSIQQVNCF